MRLPDLFTGESLRSDTSGTYCVRNGDDGPVKIGKARNIAKRMVTLRTAVPFLKLLAYTDRSSDERLLHVAFAAHRVSGEWFSFCPEIADYVASATTPCFGSRSRRRRAPDVRLACQTLAGARLGQVVALRGLTFAAIAPRIGCVPSSGNVSRLVSGERKPSLLLAIAIEREFGIPVDHWDIPAASKGAA